MAAPDTDSEGSISVDYGEQLARDLWEAVSNNDLDRVKYLLGQGADVQHQLYQTEEWGLTYPFKSYPLHRACRGGYLPIVMALVEHGADKDVKDKDGLNLIHIACVVGRKDVVQYLVEDLKCDVDMTDDNDMTPLDHTYDPDVALYLMNHGCTCDDEHKAEILCQACEGGRLDVVKELVERNHVNPNDVSDDDWVGMYDNDDCVDVALYLVKCGCGDVERKAEILCRACYWGKLDVVKELVEQHHVNPNDCHALHDACEGGHKNIVQYLVEEANCDENLRLKEDEDTPLHSACEGGHKAVVEYLVEEAKCDINARGLEDNTPLHLACNGGHKEVVEYLVEKVNCDVNVRNKDNQTLLHKACQRGNKDVIQYLVEKTNCDVNVTDNEGRTPLDLARQSEIIDYLESRHQLSAQQGAAGRKRSCDSTESEQPATKKIPSCLNGLLHGSSKEKEEASAFNVVIIRVLWYHIRGEDNNCVFKTKPKRDCWT